MVCKNVIISKQQVKVGLKIPNSRSGKISSLFKQIMYSIN